LNSCSFPESMPQGFRVVFTLTFASLLNSSRNSTPASPMLE
jgi:hypothetical protein